jgi:hypothetical protein
VKILQMLGPNVVLQSVVQRRDESGILILEPYMIDRDQRSLMCFRVIEAPPVSPNFPNERAIWIDGAGNRFVVPRPGEFVLAYTTSTTSFAGGHESGDNSGVHLCQIQALVAIVDEPDVWTPPSEPKDKNDLIGGNRSTIIMP